MSASVVVLILAAILSACGRSGGSIAGKFYVTYNGNDNTGGSVPINPTIYVPGRPSPCSAIQATL